MNILKMKAQKIFDSRCTFFKSLAGCSQLYADSYKNIVFIISFSGYKHFDTTILICSAGETIGKRNRRQLLVLLQSLYYY